ncbi:hypothetical protein QO010_003445 [Caulobacter ginsengisoli]|uniref:Uncharacterized protein n=1 Tax=Caulobacter ginsengisoli TaxID=400775 RepID=A0ABU0IUG7_9CAUL|nr:hypothetical protein [Caulobacter ginsengisoli]MDQ0465656.1 hypothetical protein [Caulobacter ginsengisoli]
MARDEMTVARSALLALMILAPMPSSAQPAPAPSADCAVIAAAVEDWDELRNTLSPDFIERLDEPSPPWPLQTLEGQLELPGPRMPLLTGSCPAPDGRPVRVIQPLYSADRKLVLVRLYQRGSWRGYLLEPSGETWVVRVSRPLWPLEKPIDIEGVI